MKNYSEILKDVDVINVHNFPATWAIKNSKKPVVWMCNEVPWKYAPSKKFRFFFNFIQKIYKKIDYKLVRKNVDCIVVLDKKRLQDVKEFYGVNANIVRSGVDTKVYKPFSKRVARKKVEEYAKQRLSKNVVLFVSNLSEPKRLIDFLRAVSNPSLKSFELTALVIGDGPDSSMINLFSDKVKIIHLPDVPEELMPSIYNASDILIFPAVNQPWGLVPLEAMACGVPVIVSKDAGVSEVLTHLKDSILVKPKQPKEITKWIRIILENRYFRKNLLKEGVLLVRRRLTDRHYAQQMERIFKDILKKNQKKI